MNNRGLKRFFIIYLSFFLCLMLLFVPLYGMVRSLYIDNAMKTGRETLKGGMLVLENELERIYTTGLALFEDPSYSILGNTKLPLSSRRVYLLKKACDAMANTYLYLGEQISAGLIINSEIVLTSNGNAYTSPDLFYQQHLTYADFSTFAEWFEYIGDFTGSSQLLGSRAIRLSDKDHEVLTFVQRLPINAGDNKHLLYATIEKDYIIQTLLTDDMLPLAKVTLADNSGNIILSQGSVQAKEFATINHASVDYGLTATVQVDSALYERELVPLRNLALGFTSVYIVIGIALSVLYSWHSFRPVKSLIDSAAGMSAVRSIGASQPAQFESEYDYIKNFLVKTEAAFETYEATLSQQGELLRHYMLTRMLNRQVYSDRAYQTAREYFPGFPKRYRVVLLRFSMRKHLSLAEFSRKQIYWKIIMGKYLPRDAIQHFMNNLMVIVWPCGGEEAEDKAQIDEALAGVRAILPEDEQDGCRAAVSDEFSGMENLADAHQQAMQLLRIPSERVRPVLHVGDVAPSRADAYQALESMDAERFCELLRQGKGAGRKRHDRAGDVGTWSGHRQR
jgi:hypothetical protein